MEIKRRDFLRLFGGLSGALVFAGCGLDDVLELPESLIERLKNGAGLETWKNTTCGLCPGGCGISVRLVDGIPVYVRGNTIYPVNQGGMCPLGLNALHLLYHPDRLKGPVHQVGKIDNRRLESLLWDDALKSITDKLVILRNEGKSHQVAFLGHDERGLLRQHISRFMKAYGSPNYFQFSSLQNDSVPYSLLHGHSKLPTFDFLNTKLVVSFGSNFLEEGYSPIYYTKLYSRHQERQTRYIQIESRMSLTAANADKWVPIRPGTYGALALGFAYVLIREELYDFDFVKNHTHGFEDWVDQAGRMHVGFKSIVLENYYPERVSEITGIPNGTILELARDLGNTRPALIVGGEGVHSNTNGTFALMAVNSLNALLGNFEREGGIFIIDEPPLGKFPSIQEDSIAREGNRYTGIADSIDGNFPLSNFSMDSFAKNVLSGKPYPISVLFLYKGNSLFHALNHQDLANALKKIPLIVSFDSIINETSEFAHFVLPAHTFLEQWDEVSNVPSVAFEHIGIQQPVIEPLYGTRHPGDVLIDLANRIGGTVAASFPYKSYVDVLKIGLKGVYESGEGAIVSAEVRQHWLEYLQQRGWQIGRYASFEDFWDRLLEHGGWWNPIRKKKTLEEVFQTTSGRFEFYSQKLKRVVDKLVAREGPKDSPENLELVLNRLNISARGDSVFLPHHEVVPYEADMPLYLTVFQVLPNRDGQGSVLPMMQEMFGYVTREYWQSWVEINPETAKAYGIADGVWVWIESSVGKMKVKAKVTPGIMPNVLAVPFGMGHTSYGRYAKGHGANPNMIMRNLQDSISGKPALGGTKVKISLVT